MRRAVACFFVAIAPILAQSVPTAASRGAINLRRVPSSMAYHRVWAVTPLVGTGKTPGDPVRPMFAPAPPASGQRGTAPTATAPNRSGVIGYQMQLSDDGKFALVEYVFQDPIAFQTALLQEAAARGILVNPSATRPASAPGLAPPSAAQIALEAGVPGLKIFERGKALDADILAEFKTHAANLTLGLGR